MLLSYLSQKISGRRKQYLCNVFCPQSDLASFLGALDGLRSRRTLRVLPSGVRVAIRRIFWIFCSLWILEQFRPSPYLARQPLTPFQGNSMMSRKTMTFMKMR